MFIIDKFYINSCDLLPYACLSWYLLRCTQIIEEFRETSYPNNGRWVLFSDLMQLKCWLLSLPLQKDPVFGLKLTILNASHFVHQQWQTYRASLHCNPWACENHCLDHVFLFGAWIAITNFFETDVSTAWSPGDECLVN